MLLTVRCKRRESIKGNELLSNHKADLEDLKNSQAFLNKMVGMVWQYNLEQRDPGV